MSKSLEDFNFKHIAKYDISLIKDYVSSFSKEWFIDTSRQEIFDTHKDTESYFVYKADLGWQSKDEFSVDKKINNDLLFELIEPIILDLEKIHSGTRGNVLFIKLKSGCNIPSHRDGGHYLTSSRRHHLPIITSENTLFSVGSETINMSEGDCWEINNTRLHAVENNGSIDRVHLLIDIMPNKEIGTK